MKTKIACCIMLLGCFLFQTPASATTAPSNLKVIAGSGQATLYWGYPSGSLSGTTFTVYQSVDTGGGGSYSWSSPTSVASGLTSSSSPCSFTCTGLTTSGNNGYRWYVVAINSGGTSSANSNTAYAQDNATELAASALSAVAASGQVTLTWTPNSAATSYNLYRSSATGGEGSVPYLVSVAYSTNSSGMPYFVDTGLTNGTAYYYEVAAVNVGSEGNLSSERAGTPGSTAPGAPQNLSAQAGSSTVTLNWNAVSAATAFSVYRSTECAGYGSTTPVLAYNGTSATTFTDNSPSPGPGCTNYYGVTATNANGESAQSSPTITAVTGSTVLSAPTGVTATGGSTIAISWNSVTSATTYNVYRGTSAGGEGNSAYTTQVSTTSYTDTAVGAGLTYYYKITGVYTGGEGSKSAEVSATIIPAAPAGLTATGGNEQVSLSWSASTGAASYCVYRGVTSGGESATPIASSITSTSYTNTGLTNTTTYYFKVAAVDASGTSPESSEASATPELTAPPAPNGLVAGSSNAQATLYWNPALTATAYNVYRGTTSGGESATAIASGLTTCKYVDTAVSNSGSYYYKVAAANSIGTGGMSSETTASPSTTSTTVIDPLNDWTIIGSKSANWALDTTTAAPDLNGDVSLAYRTVADTEYFAYNFPNMTSFWATVYVVSAPSSAITFWYSTNNGSSYTQLSTAVSSLTATANSWGYYTYSNSGTPPTGITNLKIQNNYTGDNWDGQIGEVSVTYAVSSTPATPTGLTATAGNAQVALTWSPSSGATAYDVYDSEASGAEGSTPIASGIIPTTYTITGLTNTTTYYFKVSAVNPDGTSAQSSEVTATPELPAPTAPNGLVSGSSSGQDTLYWYPAVTATTYDVYRGTSTNGESSTPIATGLTTGKYVDSGLTNGSTYYYKVTAVNGGGASGMSTEASASPSSTTTVVIDPLNDWTIIGSSSANWEFDTTVDADFNGDASRAIRTDADSGYLAYNFSTIVSFSAIVYCYSAPSSDVTFWYSTNSGTSYTQASTSVSSITPTTAGWGYYTFANSGSLASGVTNLEIQNSYTGNNWDGEIGQVEMTYTHAAFPAPPTNLTATAGYEQVSLSWTASSLATSYSVYTASGTLVASGVTTTSYTITGLTDGQTYSYYVEAVNANASSGPSNTASATPEPPVPAAPTGLAATIGDETVSLSWTGSTYATSYNVYRGGSSNGESSTPIATGLTTTAFTNTGLTDGTPYYYTVAAVDVMGTSPPSNEATATPAADAIVSGPTATVNCQAATITWTSNWSSQTQVNYGTTTSLGTNVPDTAWTTSNSVTLTGLSAGTTYYYTVTSNDGVTSVTSAVESFETAPPGFTMNFNPTSASLSPGQGALSILTVTGTCGFSGTVNLTVAPPESWITGYLGAPSVAITWPNGWASTSFAVGVLPGGSSGTQTISINGTSGSATASASYAVQVNDPAFNLTSSAGTMVAAQGSTGVATIAVTNTPGFEGPVTLSIVNSTSNLPTGVTANFSSTSIVPGSPVQLAINVPASAAPAPYTFQVAGAGPNATQNLTMTLNVVPDDTSGSASNLNPDVSSWVSASTPSANCQIVAGAAVSLPASGMDQIPLQIARASGYTTPLTLSVEGDPVGAVAFPATLVYSESSLWYYTADIGNEYTVTAVDPSGNYVCGATVEATTP